MGPRECPPSLFELWRGLAVALRAEAEACRGSGGEAQVIATTAPRTGMSRNDWELVNAAALGRTFLVSRIFELEPPRPMVAAC
jgi:hypothetical protein